jgi:peptidoglycan-associated lipoprotein
MTFRRLAVLTGVVLAAVLAGCSSTKLTEPTAQAPVETRTPLPAGQVGATPPGATPAAAAPRSQVATVDLAKTAPGAATPGAAGGAATPGQRVVYFDYDSFAIKDEFKSLVDGHAKALSSNRSRRMVIEGHTDERGGREYNLALGQKRADAVARALELLGVPANQLEAVSFGEERPAATGQDEAAWAKNRRAELKDR